MLDAIDHVAIICSDYVRSRAFYVETLGLAVVSEVYREPRDSWKLNLALPDGSQLEIFSFPEPPSRLSYPEACGLRHLAFKVANVNAASEWLQSLGIEHEPIRLDELTGKPFLFFADPDGLPIELYQS